VDPLGFAAGQENLYQYVGNDPTNATDPIGLEAKPETTFTIPDAVLKEAYSGPRKLDSRISYCSAVRERG
jgi:uncharacterized protein RhaS with RHS repeats